MKRLLLVALLVSACTRGEAITPAPGGPDVTTGRPVTPDAPRRDAPTIRVEGRAPTPGLRSIVTLV